MTIKTVKMSNIVGTSLIILKNLDVLMFLSSLKLLRQLAK